jgi:lipopolysaccharide transport system permease protein
MAMATDSTITAPPAAAAAPVSTETRLVVATKKRIKLSDVWRSRAVAKVVAARDLKVKYKQSLLGPLWLLIQPLGILAAMIVAFHGVASVDTGGVGYVPFSLTGLAVWTLVQMTLLNGVQALLANALLIRRVNAPRIAFVSGAVLSNLPAPIVTFAAALITLLASGQGLQIQILLLPAVIVWLLVFTFALVCVFAALAVRFRDILSLLPFWSQAGLFLTPVGFSLATAPGKVQTLLTLNPLSGLLELTRWCVLGTPLTAPPVIVSAVGSVIIAWVGWEVFARIEVRFADII